MKDIIGRRKGTSQNDYQAWRV